MKPLACFSARWLGLAFEKRGAGSQRRFGFAQAHHGGRAGFDGRGWHGTAREQAGTNTPNQSHDKRNRHPETEGARMSSSEAVGGPPGSERGAEVSK